MWIVRRYRLSTLCFISLLVLFSIWLFLTFYDKTLPNKLFDITIGENSSREYLRVQLDLESVQAICQPDDYLLIYILSTITNIQRRDIVRSTWGSKRNGTCFVFIIGDVSGIIPDAGEFQMRVNQERNKYHDIVQINHVESYANVVYKEVAALQWSRKFYPNIPYLFKTDDDLIVDSILLSSIAKMLLTNVTTNDILTPKYHSLLLRNIRSSDRETFFRSVAALKFQPTVRHGKFGISESVWPHQFLPPYCSGFGWFMSKQIRDRLVKASYTYPLNKVAWIGDVFISGFLAKAANVKCTFIPMEYDSPSTHNCSCLMANNPLLTICASGFHYGDATEEEKYNEYRKSWKVIQLRYNLIDTIAIHC